MEKKKGQPKEETPIPEEPGAARRIEESQGGTPPPGTTGPSVPPTKEDPPRAGEPPTFTPTSGPGGARRGSTPPSGAQPGQVQSQTTGEQMGLYGTRPGELQRTASRRAETGPERYAEDTSGFHADPRVTGALRDAIPEDQLQRILRDAGASDVEGFPQDVFREVVAAQVAQRIQRHPAPDELRAKYRVDLDFVRRIEDVIQPDRVRPVAQSLGLEESDDTLNNIRGVLSMEIAAVAKEAVQYAKEQSQAVNPGTIAVGALRVFTFEKGLEPPGTRSGREAREASGEAPTSAAPEGSATKP